MAIYTGNNVSNLTLVAQNDDVAFPSDLTSQSEFPVTAGTIYMIKIDGLEGDSGKVILNWNATGSFSGGTLGFRRSGFGHQLESVVYHRADRFGADGVHRHGILRTSGPGDPDERICLSKIAVNYTVTNSSFVDTLVTNFYGTNLFITNADGTFANILSTNVVAIDLIGTYLNGFITQFATTNALSAWPDQQ